MKLDKPALPVSFSQEDALASIEDEIKAKNWQEFKVGELKLLYVPFFVFNYEAFVESKTEESETPIVAETQSGRTALNAFTSELDEEIASLFEDEELQPEKSAQKEYAFELQKTRLKDDEAKQIAQVKLAAQLSMGKNNIILSAFEMVYIPFWTASATVGEQEYGIKINAVSGSMAGLEDLPAKEKSAGELAKETIFELRNPAAWVKYSVSIVMDAAKWVWNSAPVKFLVDQSLHNQRFQISILLCIIILVALKETGFL